MEEPTPTQSTHTWTTHVYTIVDIPPNENTTPMEVDTVGTNNIIRTREYMFRFLSHAIESKGVRTVTRQLPINPDGKESQLTGRLILDTMKALSIQYVRDNQIRMSRVCIVCNGYATNIYRFVLSRVLFNSRNTLKSFAIGHMP